MEKYIDIELKGVNNSSTEELCNTGDVSMAFGLTSEKCISTPVKPIKTHLFNIDGCEVLLIHGGSSFKNVFVYNPDTDNVHAYAYDDLLSEREGLSPMCTIEGKPGSFTTIGNIVIICFSDKTRFLYRNADTYIVRSNKIPPLSMDIAAAYRYTSPLRDDSGAWNVGAGDYPDGLFPVEYWDNLDTVHLTPLGDNNDRKTENETEQRIMGVFNKMIADWGSYGYLFSPVIVRAAYRLKSGEIAGLTNPVLCFPFEEPMLAVAGTANGWRYRGLGYKLFAKFTMPDMELYKDIIDSVEVYMSAPVYTHSINGTDIRIYDSTSKDFNGFKDFFNVDGITKVIVLGKKDGLSFENLETVCNFYKVRSIPYDSNEFYRGTDGWTDDEEYRDEEIYMGHTGYRLVGYRKLLTRADGRDMDVTTDNVVTLPVMEDVLRGNIDSYPDRVTSYNSRLIAIGNRYNLASLAESGIISRFSTLVSMDKKGGPDIPYFLYGLYSGIAESCDTITGQHAVFQFEYSDDRNCVPKYLTCEEINTTAITGMIIKDDGRYLATLHFRQHAYLNLAYFTGKVTYERMYDEDKEVLDRFMKLLDAIKDPDNAIIHRSDYIRGSNVADPYTFDSSNNAYFNSKVKDVLVVPESISLGQYGTDQMYAICEDGIFTVDINDEGKLNSVHTYTQDIIDPDKTCIVKTQLFVNNSLSWDYFSKQQKITFFPLSRNFAFHFKNLPHLADLELSAIWKEIMEDNVLFKFLQDCTPLYDSRNDMIAGISANGKYVAVWKQGYGMHMLSCNASRHVHANGLVLSDKEQNIYEFVKPELEDRAVGIIVTRSLHFGQGIDGYKTVRKVIARGVFDKKKVKLALYGTRNYSDWLLVSTSNTYFINNISGTAYKAFRLVVFAELARDEYISHISVCYADRANKVHY